MDDKEWKKRTIYELEQLLREPALQDPETVVLIGEDFNYYLN